MKKIVLILCFCFVVLLSYSCFLFHTHYINEEHNIWLPTSIGIAYGKVLKYFGCCTGGDESNIEKYKNKNYFHVELHGDGTPETYGEFRKRNFTPDADETTSINSPRGSCTDDTGQTVEIDYSERNIGRHFNNK